MTRYQNPILTGTYPDPSICRVGSDYYLVVSSFCYFPGVPIFHSRDLVHWRQIGHCLTRPSQLNVEGVASAHGIFAPTIRYHNGRFYMVTTLVGGGGNFYVHTEDPAGEWSDPVWVDVDGIDPTLFFDDDGRVYLVSTSEPPQGIYLIEIDLATGKGISERKMIWTGTGGRHPEAPHIYRHNGYYYVLISEGGTSYAHCITIARSKNLWGPYESCPDNPIFSHQNHYAHPIQATGHADLVTDEAGNWWMICLAIRPTTLYFQSHHLGRETMLAPVSWNEDGWLVINKGQLLEFEMDAPLPPAHIWDVPAPRDDFDAPELALDWNFIRNPRPNMYSLTDRAGHLRLYGNASTLDNLHPTFVGRRQREFVSVISTALQFDPHAHGEEAGISIYQTEVHHYEVGMMHDSGVRWLFVRQRNGDVTAVVAKIQWDSSQVVLMIQSTATQYRLGYADENGVFHPLATAQTRYVSSEIAGSFTGVWLGMYVVGASHADFDWFEIKV